MNAADVAAALTRRWPEDRHLHIAEATFNPWRQGSKIDVAVVACWKSLGWEIDAVEIKVSLSDFRNEIERPYWTVEGDDRHYHSRRAASASRFARTKPDGEPAWKMEECDELWPVTRHTEPCLHKSEPWREVAHRFWIAAPSKVAAKIEPLLPDDWGLLAVDGRGCTMAVRPVKNRDPRILEWHEQVGLLRCAMDASLNVRARAFDKGATAAWICAGQDPADLEPRLLTGRPL